TLGDWDVPQGKLLLDANGDLYGTARGSVGAGDPDTVFKVSGITSSPIVAPSGTVNTRNFMGADARTVTIYGFGFSPTAANNRVTFNLGAVGTVTAATATSLTVTFSTRPTTAGFLTAVVTTNGVSSGAPVQVVQVNPVVTPSTAPLALNASQIII